MSSQSSVADHHHGPVLPHIDNEEPFVAIVKKLSFYICDAITLPSSIEQLRTTHAGTSIRVLTEHLVKSVTNPAIVNSLLILKWHFSSLDQDDRGINETRANACEVLAWRFLSHLPERDAIDYALWELPPCGIVHHHEDTDCSAPGPASPSERASTDVDERTSLLPQFRGQDHPTSPTPSLRPPKSKRERLMRSVSHIANSIHDSDDEEDPTSAFIGLNALEIAAVADCKKFLSQRIVQKIVNGIWIGEITFWESISPNTKKKAQWYNKHKSDPFTRLRVPRYIKAFEVVFFLTFLALYYAVLVERNPYKITPLEILLYFWIAAFAYDELSEFIDAGSLFYSVDFWNTWDLAIILVGIAFLIARIVGMVKDSDKIIDTAFDILSLEALFLVPRICSLLSLHPYFGTLIPCLKGMTKDFVKFMAIVAILYLGFLTTFSLLGRDHFTLKHMSWTLVKVFFGSTYLGFDIMNDISPHLGPPLMMVFIIMTNILLITSLTSIMSDSFRRVIAQARDEYLFVYSVYVLEASTSNRLTHFYPPLNLIPLIFVRPLRLLLPADSIRSIRILLLKTTHSPVVLCIYIFESLHQWFRGDISVFNHSTEGKLKTKKSRPFLVDRSKTGMLDPLGAVNGPSMPMKGDAGNAGDKNGEEGMGLGRDRVEIVTEREARLEAKVEDLSVKIDELTALIINMQGSKPMVH